VREVQDIEPRTLTHGIHFCPLGYRTSPPLTQCSSSTLNSYFYNRNGYYTSLVTNVRYLQLKGEDIAKIGRFAGEGQGLMRSETFAVTGAAGKPYGDGHFWVEISPPSLRSGCHLQSVFAPKPPVPIYAHQNVHRVDDPALIALYRCDGCFGSLNRWIYFKSLQFRSGLPAGPLNIKCPNFALSTLLWLRRWGTRNRMPSISSRHCPISITCPIPIRILH
jgi:hypothetical protein